MGKITEKENLQTVNNEKRSNFSLFVMLIIGKSDFLLFFMQIELILFYFLCKID